MEASVKDMIAGYVGQTVEKTRRLMENALGKVLFIDEAYRLTENENGDSFTREARDELVDAMTKPKFCGKKVIILAGYESNMNSMLSANPGLASRFETRIHFCNLSSDACVALLQKRVEESGVKVVLGDNEDMIEDYFERLGAMDGWGNGRDVEPIARRTIGQVFESCADEALPTANGHLILDVLDKWSTQKYARLPLARRQRATTEVKELRTTFNPGSKYVIKDENSSNSVLRSPARLPKSKTFGESEKLCETIDDRQSIPNITHSSRKNLYSVPLDQSRKETRTLSIFPEALPKISYELRIVALVERPRFYALSYVWGDPNDTTNIEVNGKSVAVTKSLETALRRLSNFDNGKYSKDIWIDALCINQADLDEKAYQVPLMGEIYSHTERVIGWLGQEDDNSDALFENVRRILKCRAENTLDDLSVLEIWGDLVNGLTHCSSFWERLWIVSNSHLL